MGESWIVSNLNAALSTWNDKLAEIWSLLTESPQTFKGGQVWGVMTGIHGALQAIGYGLLVLFFAVGVMKTCGSDTLLIPELPDWVMMVETIPCTIENKASINSSP